jgi:hypothetical protein
MNSIIEREKNMLFIMRWEVASVENRVGDGWVVIREWERGS